jgi:hypothetical protein
MCQPLLSITHGTNDSAIVDAVRRTGSALKAEREHLSPHNGIALMLVPALVNVGRSFAFAQSSADLAHVACALERHRLAHGSYPDSLDTLTPQFIENIPHDLINGQPLHYHRTDDGQFILYSVGWNEKDDGGVVSLRESGSVDIEKGDWVWRYPAN